MLLFWVPRCASTRHNAEHRFSQSGRVFRQTTPEHMDAHPVKDRAREAYEQALEAPQKRKRPFRGCIIFRLTRGYGHEYGTRESGL